MGRPKSNRVDYFSHDTDASGKKTLTIIEGLFGNNGYTFWYKLLEWLGGFCEGHYYDARKSSDLEFLVQKCGRLDVVSGTEILNKLSELGAIDKILWEHRIIWSQNMVDRFKDVYKKRGREVPNKPYFCNGKCNHSDILEIISEPEKTEPIVEEEINSPENTQSKVNKSKGKEIKEEENTPTLFKLGEFENVLILDTDYQKLIDRFGKDKTDDLIEQLSAYMRKTGKKYNDHYATILTWARMDNRKDKSKQPKDRDPDKYFKGKYGNMVRR